MKIRLIASAMLWLKITMGFAQLTPGVYTAEEQNCGRKSEKIQLAIFKMGENYYQAELRILTEEYARPQLFAVEYTGGYINNEFILNKGQTRIILNEKLSSTNYDPGEQQAVLHSSGFAYKQLRIVPSSYAKELTIRAQRGESSCYYPILKYDPALSEQYTAVHTSIQQKINSSPISFFSAKTVNEKVFVLYRWGEKLMQEYLSTNLNDLNEAASTLYLTKNFVYKLFRDDHFIRFFDEPFDQLDDKKKQEVLNEIFELNKMLPRINKNNNYAYLLTWQANLLKAALSSCVNYSNGVCTKNVTSFVNTARPQKRRYVEILNTLSNSSLSLAQLNSVKIEIERMEPSLWPSESSLALKRHLEKELPAAEAELLNQVSKLVTASVDDSNLQALEKAASMELLRKVSPGIRDQQLLKIKQAKEKMLQQLMQTEMQNVQKLKSIPDPFVGGHRWHQGFQKKYGQVYANNSAVQEVLKAYQDQHIALLSSTKSTILEEINQATTNEALFQISTKYLHSAQRGNPIYDELFLAVNKQQGNIDAKTKKIMGGYTYEQIVAIENTTTETGEPTEDQMRLASLKILHNATQRFESMANSNSGFHQWLGRSGLMSQYSLPVFEKLGCVKATNRPGYICDCRMVVKINMSGAHGVLVDILGTIAGADVPRTVTHRYIKSDKYGWINIGEVEK